MRGRIAGKARFFLNAWTVKNWLAGISGPNGQHLVEPIRNSDEVLDVFCSWPGDSRFAPTAVRAGTLDYDGVLCTSN